jgi:hypothetical protein
VTTFFSIFSALVLAVITVDVPNKSVKFTAKSTGLGKTSVLEFFAVGEGSDHDYESMFVLEDPIRSFTEAFEKIGLPKGKDVDYSKCRFWPVGVKLSMEPSLSELVSDCGTNAPCDVIYSGGKRGPDNIPVAHTNMPLSLFAFYNLPESILQLNDTLDQATAYGRFSPKVEIPKGEVRTFTLKWDGKTEDSKREITPDFKGEYTVSEAVKIALGLSKIDSPVAKINGFKEGQFYYRAFLPQEAWRQRSMRLAQPYEIHLSKSLPLTIIKEDWSEGSFDPKLIVSEHSLDYLKEEKSLKVDTCFFYVNGDTRLREIYEIAKLMPRKIKNFYVFIEQ